MKLPMLGITWTLSQFSANSSIAFGRTAGPMIRMKEAIKSHRYINRKDAKISYRTCTWANIGSDLDIWNKVPWNQDASKAHLSFKSVKTKTPKMLGGGRRKKRQYELLLQAASLKKISDNFSKVVLKMAQENNHICWLSEFNSSENLSCCLQRKTTSIRNTSSISWELHLPCNHCLGSYKQFSLFLAFLWHP